MICAILLAGFTVSAIATPVSSAMNAARASMDPFNHGMEMLMRALFVGGTVDNTEVEIDGREPPLHYPPSTGSGQPRYRLHLVGKQDETIVYGVYGAPELPDNEVKRVADERGYARRFAARVEATAV
jgi:hypothetical protein